MHCRRAHQGQEGERPTGEGLRRIDRQFLHPTPSIDSYRSKVVRQRRRTNSASLTQRMLRPTCSFSISRPQPRCCATSDSAACSTVAALSAAGAAASGGAGDAAPGAAAEGVAAAAGAAAAGAAASAPALGAPTAGARAPGCCCCSAVPAAAPAAAGCCGAAAFFLGAAQARQSRSRRAASTHTGTCRSEQQQRVCLGLVVNAA